MKMTAEEMLGKFSNGSAHPIEVRRLAMMIFDETSAKIRELSNKHRKYLENAALLHDIGYYIDSKGHNKHSLEMITEHGLKGFDEEETAIIGCIARYHRSKLPNKNKHKIYCDLDKKQRKTVKRLAGILRIADGLDRAHLGLIKVVTLNYDEKSNIVEFLLSQNTPDYRPDITSAIRKRYLYEIGFKVQTIFKFQDDNIL